VAALRLIGLAFAVPVLSWAHPVSANADDHVNANDNNDMYDVGVKDGQRGSDEPGSDDENSPAAHTPTIPTHVEPVCSDHGGQSYNDGNACWSIVQCETSDGTHSYLVQEVADTEPPQTVATWCVGEQEIQEIQPTVTPGLVLEAFEQIPLPKSELVIQPPKGTAPVDLEVVYSTIAEDQDQSVQLLGKTVYLKIWPSAYTWHTGDPSDLPDNERDFSTDWPGRTFDASLPDMGSYIWHKYLTAGDVTPAVDVTYSAEFSVGDKTHWQTVDGTVTVEGAPNPLTITPLHSVLNGSS